MRVIRAALHLKAGPNPLEAECPFLGWRPASTTHYNNKIIPGANFPICKGLRVKKLGRFDKFSIIQRDLAEFSIELFRFPHNLTDLVR